MLFSLAASRFYSIVNAIEFRLDGVVAQLAERLVRNEKVAGSIPVGSTIQILKENASSAYKHWPKAASPPIREPRVVGSCGLVIPQLQ